MTGELAPSAPRAPRRSRLGKRQSGLPGFIWATPALIVTGFILGWPLLRVIYESFTSKTFFNPGEFVGFDNYESLFGTPLFWSAFRNNLILLLSVPVSIVVALVVTALLFRGIWGSRLYEFLIFLPFLPAVAAISVIFIFLLKADGPLNVSLEAVGLDLLARSWLTDPNLAIWSILGVVTWKRIGLIVLLFMARALGLERDHFDAAALDGARWWQAFRYVAIPQMRSIIQFGVILGFIEVFSFTFAYVFVLTRGGPFNQTYNLEMLIWRTQFSQKLVGLASAIAVILFGLALSIAVYRVWVARHEGMA